MMNDGAHRWQSAKHRDPINRWEPLLNLSRPRHVIAAILLVSKSTFTNLSTLLDIRYRSAIAVLHSTKWQEPLVGTNAWQLEIWECWIMPNFVFYAYAAFASALTNIQVGADLRLFRSLNNPALTAVVILLVGLVTATLALFAWWAIVGLSVPPMADLARIPWWAWAGGALQGLTVLAVFLTAGRAGATLFSALTVTGGAVCALVLDHFGLVGFDQHSATWSRVGGVALLIGGTLLISR
jgi:transporter family-2 protein